MPRKADETVVAVSRFPQGIRKRAIRNAGLYDRKSDSSKDAKAHNSGIAELAVGTMAPDEESDAGAGCGLTFGTRFLTNVVCWPLAVSGHFAQRLKVAQNNQMLTIKWQPNPCAGQERDACPKQGRTSL